MGSVWIGRSMVDLHTTHHSGATARELALAMGHQGCAEALQQAEEEAAATTTSPDGGGASLYALAAQGRHDELKQELDRVRQATQAELAAAGWEGGGAMASKKAVAESLRQVRMCMYVYACCLIWVLVCYTLPLG